MPITTAGNAWFLAKRDEDIDALRAVLETLPGVRKVDATPINDTNLARLLIIGTDRGKRMALAVAGVAKAYEPDHNADHDHAKCVESARKMGVPEAYAHTPETYLSA